MSDSPFPAFRALPWLRNGHAQTVAGYALFRARSLGATRQHRLALADGDRVVLHDDCPSGWLSGGPTALLLHGLCGDHASSYVARVAGKLNRQGVRTFRMDQRGCGAGLGLARRTYHAGNSADVLEALQAVTQWCPGSRISLIGFSLGGNVALKLAGEFVGRLPGELRQVIAISPPIDLAAAAARLRGVANRFYDRFFQKYLQRLVAPLRQADAAAIPPFRTLEEFNERYLSRVWGFGGAARYYALCSAAPFLPAIRLPTLVLTARDDPLIPVRSFEEATFSPTTRLVMTEHGGHLSFLGRATPLDPDWHWMDWRVVEMVTGARGPSRQPVRSEGYRPAVQTSRPVLSKVGPASPERMDRNARAAAARRLQQSFALGTVALPFLGLVVAVSLLWGHGLGRLEVGLLLGMHVLGLVGIGVGYHRLLAHGSFQTWRALRAALAILGSMAAQGPVLYWAGIHRGHHAHSDRPGDPHSPNLHGDGLLGLLRGAWHAHIGWMFTYHSGDWARYVPDLRRDPALVLVQRFYFLWVFLGLLLPALVGGCITGTAFGFLQGFLWGGLVRVLVGQHTIWSVGSICHLCGSRAFATPDESRNNFWLTLPALGEAWHNNHHAFPYAAVHGLRWWQFDPNGWCIRALKWCGLAWNVKAPSADALRQLKPLASEPGGGTTSAA